MKPVHRRYLALSVFTAGLATLGVELTASRLLGNVFGTSNLVWANIIGLILIYLTAGYFIGGRWADRSPSPVTFYTLLAWAAFAAGLAPLAARPVLQFAARAMERFDAPVLGGSFLSALLLFSAPITLLGCVSPFAIRLALTDSRHAGQVSGRVYAVSTLGSIAGTFAPTLWLIPSLGTMRTFLSLAGLLMLVALVGLWRVDRRRALLLLWMPLVVGLLASVTISGSLKPTAGLLDERESEYNFIQVVERGGTRYLLLNEGQGIHSVYNPQQLETFGTWDYFLVAPLFNPPPRTLSQVRRLALVGLAAGTISKQYTRVYGPIPIDGIEIDPGIVEVGRRYFDMTEPNLNVIVQDGRWALAHSEASYSVIGVDAYRLPYIPWHLTTREFFQEARDHLEDDGALVINVGRTRTDRRLIDAMAGTLQSVFASVHVVDVPGTFNSILFATVQFTTAANLRANLAGMDRSTPPLLRSAAARAVENLQPTPAAEVIFTDDWAPVEQLTNSIVLRFILAGSFDQLDGD
ncbi:MAG: fused MFS/spermidine synthase [Anaerolineales bacterium]|nr:fused MFS/spermidine synthase [Anaerolineales bacterium]